MWSLTRAFTGFSGTVTTGAVKPTSEAKVDLRRLSTIVWSLIDASVPTHWTSLRLR